MLDRIDLQIDIPPVTPADLALPPAAEGTAEAAARVAHARALQMERGALNAHLTGETFDRYASPDEPGRALLLRACETLGLTARGYHRILRVARTLADLDQSEQVRRIHVAEALSARRASSTGQAVSMPAALQAGQTVSTLR